MISIIIPTRNRSYTIKQVASSYYVQKHVSEIIFVDDCGDDNTEEIVKQFSNIYPNIVTKYIRHEKRKGASAGRITGYTNAVNEYILFGEDDAFLEHDYTGKLLKKLSSDPTIGIVSGRIIYMLPQENQDDALDRFGTGFEAKPYLNRYSFIFNKDAELSGDFYVPFTHALFLTTKKLLEDFSYDPFYARGNETHCFHLHTSDVPSGGQRINRFQKFYWNVYYTAYMYDKYFDRFKQPLQLKYSKRMAKFLFAMSQFYQLFIRPFRKLPTYLYHKVFK
jgi:glycosyltransferase involved in cell wall biosynthesis